MHRIDLLRCMLEQRRQIDRLEEELSAAKAEAAEAKKALEGERKAQSDRRMLLAQQEEIGRLRERLLSAEKNMGETAVAKAGNHTIRRGIVR